MASHPHVSGQPVVLSLGMGADSSAILLRWLTDPSSRNFDLSDLVVVTAQLGAEFERTYMLVERHILPRLAEAGVRYIQAARGGPRESDGVCILSDTTAPATLVRRGPWTLADELRSAGTVPMVASGRRLCTHKHKGWVLDQVIADVVGDQPFRHIIGFNADEERRAERDQNYTTDTRHAEYPLIEWGWGRARLEAWLEHLVGEQWEKSCCGYCPFAACSGGRASHMARWADEPERGVEALLLEHTSLALNPRMALYGTASAYDIAIDSSLGDVVAEFHRRLASTPHALYRVRRIWTAGRNPSTGRSDPQKKGVGWRSVETLAAGSRTAMAATLAHRASADGRRCVDDRHHSRLWIRTAGDCYPTAEEFLVVAPAGVETKQRPGFNSLWQAVTTPQMPLFAAAS